GRGTSAEMDRPFSARPVDSGRPRRAEEETRHATATAWRWAGPGRGGGVHGLHLLSQTAAGARAVLPAGGDRRRAARGPGARRGGAAGGAVAPGGRGRGGVLPPGRKPAGTSPGARRTPRLESERTFLEGRCAPAAAGAHQPSPPLSPSPAHALALPARAAPLR